MNKALYEIDIHDNKKVFALTWLNKNEFLSGGEDRKVNKHVFN